MDAIRDLQRSTWRCLAALEGAVRSATVSGAGDLTATLAEVERFRAQLDGLTMEALSRARLLDEGAQVLDAAVSSTADTDGRNRSRVRLSAELDERYELVGAALRRGRISFPQAEAICSGLRRISAPISMQEIVRAQEYVLAHADGLGPAELRVLAVRVFELLDPDGAEAEEQVRLEREERRARQDRSLRLRPDHHGSMIITGRVPVADGALLQAQLDALRPARSTYVGEEPPKDARTADALMRLVGIAANSGNLPALGTDRPHVVVTLGLDTLHSGLGPVGVAGTNEQVTAGEARRLACDSGIIPVVLGSSSEALDVGRAQRLFPKSVRTALMLRDGGCAFPSCTATPAACEAHHIVPWWAGGKSALSNAVLLCPHHHRLVEPDPHQSEHSQWQVALDPVTGLPWFTPPRHVDPDRRRRRHHRHVLRDAVPVREPPQLVASPAWVPADP